MPILLHLMLERRQLRRRGPSARRRAGGIVEPGGFGEGALAVAVGVVVAAAGAGEAGETATGRGGGGEEGEGFALLVAAVEVDCCKGEEDEGRG